MMFNRQSAEAFASRNFHNSLSCKFNNCNHINPPDCMGVRGGPWVRRTHIFKQDVWSPSTVVCVPWLMCLDSARRLSSVMSGATLEKAKTLCGSGKTCSKDVNQLFPRGPAAFARTSEAEAFKASALQEVHFLHPVRKHCVLDFFRLLHFSEKKKWLALCDVTKGTGTFSQVCFQFCEKSNKAGGCKHNAKYATYERSREFFWNDSLNSRWKCHDAWRWQAIDDTSGWHLRSLCRDHVSETRRRWSLNSFWSSQIRTFHFLNVGCDPSLSGYSWINGYNLKIES